MHYRGVIDQAGEKQVIYNEKEIPHVSSTDHDSDTTLDWGYTGRGPLNTANSIMDHALGSESEFVNTRKHTIEFRARFLSSLDAADENWRISRKEVRDFIREQETNSAE